MKTVSYNGKQYTVKTDTYLNGNTALILDSGSDVIRVSHNLSDTIPAHLIAIDSEDLLNVLQAAGVIGDLAAVKRSGMRNYGLYTVMDLI